MNDIYHQIKAACDGGVMILHDPHIVTNVSIEDYLYQLVSEVDTDELEIDTATRDLILKSNTVVVIYMYVGPPVNGSLNYYRTLHYDIEAALEAALKILKEAGRTK